MTFTKRLITVIAFALVMPLLMGVVLPALVAGFYLTLLDFIVIIMFVTLAAALIA
jgi:hypothetical protein